MKSRRIAAYRMELPLVEGSYRWSGGKSVDVFDSTLVRVETDAGVVGPGGLEPVTSSTWRMPQRPTLERASLCYDRATAPQVTGGNSR